MATITDADGVVRDLDTFKVIGREKGTSTEANILRGGVAPRGAASIPSVVQQLSAGFATSLFYLPDATVSKVGQSLGLKKEEIPQFVSLFRTDISPKNAPERFARSIGQEAGAGVVFSGILRAVAGTGALAKELPEGAGFIKRVAKQTLDFIRENPSKAVQLDAAYGGAFGALRQGYEEVFPDSGIEKDLIPAAALVAGPMALGKAAGMLPSVAAARVVKRAVPGTPAGAEDAYKQIMAGGAVPAMLTPFTRPIQRALLARGEKQISAMMGEVEKSPEAQQMLARYKELLDDPRIYEAFETTFAQRGITGTPGLDIAQQAMDPALLKAKGEMLDKLSGDMLNQVRARQLAEKEAFAAAGEALAPAAGRELPVALRGLADEATAEQTRIADELEALLGTEINRVSGSFGKPGDITGIGSSIRNTIMAANENLFKQFERTAERMGLRLQYDRDGVRIRTRDDEGKSLYPAVDVTKDIGSILGRFTLNKELIPVRSPGIVRLLGRYAGAKKPDEEQLFNEFEKIFLANYERRELAKRASSIEIGYQRMTPERAAQEEQRVLKNIVDQGKQDLQALIPVITRFAKTGKLSKADEAILATRKSSKMELESALEEYRRANPLDINLPEAVMLMDEAAKFRNGQIKFAEDAMLTRGMNKQTADKAIRLGEQVYKDIEKMTFGAFKTKMGGNWKDFKDMYDDYYSRTFEGFFPLMVAKTRGTAAREFSLPDEAVVAEAFKNSDNVRSLVQIMRPDQIAKNKELIQRGLMDWVRSKGAVDANTGLVNVARLKKIKADEAAVLKQLPNDIRGVLDDEIRLGEEYAKRVAQVKDRAEILKDDEFLGLIQKAIRPDADPTEFIVRAVKDPANMRVAVNAMNKDPESIAALRRAVFDFAREGAEGAGSLASFIDTNRKSLSILFDKQHLDDLQKLSDLQTRVFGQKDITGRIRDFSSASQKVKEAFGVSIPGAATYYRDVNAGRVSTEGTVISLLVRFAAAEDERLYNRLIDKFISDPDFARAMLDRRMAGKPLTSVPGLNREMGKLGLYLPAFVRAGFVAGAANVLEEQPTELASMPVVESSPPRPMPPAPPAGAARTMLDNLGAPPTKGLLGGSAFPMKPLRPSANISPTSMPTYEALFPNDPISALLKARNQPQNQ